MPLKVTVNKLWIHSGCQSAIGADSIRRDWAEHKSNERPGSAELRVRVSSFIEFGYRLSQDFGFFFEDVVVWWRIAIGYSLFVKERRENPEDDAKLLATHIPGVLPVRNRAKSGRPRVKKRGPSFAVLLYPPTFDSD